MGTYLIDIPKEKIEELLQRTGEDHINLAINIAVQFTLDNY